MSARLVFGSTAAAALLVSAGLACAGPLSVEGTERGLAVTGPDTPEVLKQIASAPYAPSQGASCEELAQQIATLNDILGPDLDAPAAQVKKTSIGQSAGGLVRSLIPYRGVVRFVTGAGRKEQQLGQAVVAGAARRGFLRGLAHERGCDAPPPVATPTTAAGAPVVRGQDVAATAPAPPPVGARMQAAADVALIAPPPHSAN